MRILLNKIKADFLVHIKAGINIELTKIPVTMTYKSASRTYYHYV